MKYLLALGGLIVAGVVGYFLLAPAGSPPVTDTVIAPAEPDLPADAPAAEAPVAPVAIAPEDAASAALDDEAMLENVAAGLRDALPVAVSDSLTMTDARFLPRMRIMEYSYVTSAADPGASARDMRALIEARAERICLDGRDMFGMGVTLRNSFEDRQGTLLQRTYLLPEDCQRFY